MITWRTRFIQRAIERCEWCSDVANQRHAGPTESGTWTVALFRFLASFYTVEFCRGRTIARMFAILALDAILLGRSLACARCMLVPYSVDRSYIRVWIEYEAHSTAMLTAVATLFDRSPVCVIACVWCMDSHNITKYNLRRNNQHDYVGIRSANM